MDMAPRLGVEEFALAGVLGALVWKAYRRSTTCGRVTVTLLIVAWLTLWFISVWRWLW